MPSEKRLFGSQGFFVPWMKNDAGGFDKIFGVNYDAGCSLKIDLCD
jgi:hypothetical protein